MKVSQVPERSSRAYRLMAWSGPPSSDQLRISPAKICPSVCMLRLLTGLDGCTRMARPSMAITCSLSSAVRSACALTCCASPGFTGREDAQMPAWPLARVRKPVLEPWAATSTLTVPPSLAMLRIFSFSTPVESVLTAPLPMCSRWPVTSMGARVAPTVLEP